MAGDKLGGVVEAHLPPPATLALVLVGQDRPRAGLAADGDKPAGVQLVDGHILHGSTLMATPRKHNN